MRPAAVLFALLIALLPTGRASAAEPPTLEEVERALREYLPDASGERGRARIRAWGDAAVPHLAALAERPTLGGASTTPNVCEALRDIDTVASAGVFLKILAGKTKIEGLHALVALAPHGMHRSFLEKLAASPRFKPAVLSLARGTFRGWVAELCADQGWRDQLPLLRGMLEDPRLDVREAAAKAIHTLTGERIQVARPALAFPGTRLLPDLLETPHAVPGQGRRNRDPERVRALRWLDGAPRLVTAFGSGIESLGDVLELQLRDGFPAEPSSWPLKLEIDDLVVAPTRAGGRQVVAIASEREDGRFRTKTVVAWSDDGSRRWRVELAERFLKDLAVLPGPRGPLGIVVGAGGEEGIVALGLDGQRLWQVPRTYTTYRVRTHPRLIGHLLHVGGDAALHRYDGKTVSEGRELLAKERLFASDGVLFPGPTGRPSVVLAAKRHEGDVPILVRVDASGTRVWEAVLRRPIEALALVEPPGRPRMIVFTTEAGDLWVVDEAGTLLWRRVMPGGEGDGRVATYDLDAGEIAEGRFAVLVRLLDASYLYAVKREALDRLSPEGR